MNTWCVSNTHRICEARYSIRTSKSTQLLASLSIRLTASAVSVCDVCVGTRVDGSHPSRRPTGPAPPPPRPGCEVVIRAPQCAENKANRAALMERVWTAAHLDDAQQEAQCDRIPLLLYEIKRTFITVPDSPFTSKSPPRGATRIKSLSVRCWKTHLFVCCWRVRADDNEEAVRAAGERTVINSVHTDGLISTDARSARTRSSDASGRSDAFSLTHKYLIRSWG